MSRSITRRAAIIGGAAAIAAAALPSLAMAPVAPEAEDIIALYAKQGIDQRAAVQSALREEGMIELADAFEARFPSSVHWSGPGRYAVIEGGTRPVYWITRAPKYDDGERWFKISSGFSGPLEPSDWYCRESALPLLAYRLPEYSIGRDGNALVRRRS